MTTGAIKHVGKYFISAATGAFILYWFFWPQFETKTEIVEVRNSDTVYIEVRDTIRIREIKHTFLRDTIIQDYEPKINLFTASKPFLYGNVYLTGEVLGTVLKMDIAQDFRLPTITNTLTKTETIIITEKAKGIYLGASINSELIPSIGASYLDKNWQFNYDFRPQGQVHTIGVRKKIF